MRNHLIYGTVSCRFFVPSPCSATLGAHLSTLKEGTNGMAGGGGERAERRERSRGPTKIRWSARSRAETEENAKQTMPPSLSVCASPDLLVAVLICSYFGIRCTSLRIEKATKSIVPFCAPCRSGRVLKITNMYRARKINTSQEMERN